MNMLITILLIVLPLAIASLDISIEPVWAACPESSLLEHSELLWKINENEYWSFVSSQKPHSGQSADKLRKIALDIGSQSARSELIRKLSGQKKLSCQPTYLYGDMESCTLIEPPPQARHLFTPIDHQYGADPKFILYGSIDNSNVRQELRRLIESGISFAFRPFVTPCPRTSKVPIRNGFGITMEVRSKIENAEIAIPKALNHLDKAAKYPPEFETMGLKAINSIMTSRHPFEALQHITLNYPLYKTIIAASKAPQPMFQYMSKINQIYPHDHPVVIINGLEAQPEILDAYSLTELLLLVRKFTVSGYDLLSTWFKKTPPRFNIPLNAAVTIMNDLEADQRYEAWPSALEAIFRPSRSVVKYVARNLVTCIMVVDMSMNVNAKEVIMNVVELIDQNIPIRFALLPTHLPEREIRYYYGLLVNLGLPEALKFITRQTTSVEEYAKEHPRLRSVAFLEECSNHKDALLAFKEYTQLITDFDLSQQHGHYALVNGVVVLLDGKDAYEDSMAILKVYQSELKDIQLAIRNGHLKETHDPYERIFKLNEESVMNASHSRLAPFKSMNLVDVQSKDKANMDIAKKYNSILARHLNSGHNQKNAYENQQKLMTAVKEQMRALFPVLESAQPVSRAFMAPITFGDESAAPIKMTVIMNPLTVFAQRLVSLLQYFGGDQIHCKIYLMAPAQGAERDFNSFYTFAGIESILPKADFTFAMQPDCPAGWALTVAATNVDLDNVKMRDGVHAEYKLKSLTVEGSVLDRSTGGAAAGQQISLLDGDDKVKDKSIVMGNYGYFQLSTGPGVYTVKANEEYRTIVVDRMDSLLLDRLKVDKVVNAPDVEVNKSDNDTVNIFSIASGHNYEQLLRIMMLSAVKHTKHKLVFWLIDALVSPDLRQSLDILSKKYHFSVRFVHYKWPSWLNKQTSRMRTVWAYKILFLDVLFPLDVKRILFVDADQVIRSDLYDLYSTDMSGHVYGFTAFCDSRKEAEGYRFWKTGYWKEFLQGRPYHISAMFLVDLERLRTTLTADLLRGHYQILSRDPESLSNLDQDLPNHLQPRIPIFTLPKEWLWCESWCSDEDKPKAKIIDLCSNPARAESKLDSAMRIIPEWKALNEQVLRDISRMDRSDQKEL